MLNCLAKAMVKWEKFAVLFILCAVIFMRCSLVDLLMVGWPFVACSKHILPYQWICETLIQLCHAYITNCFLTETGGGNPESEEHHA